MELKFLKRLKRLNTHNGTAVGRGIFLNDMDVDLLVTHITTVKIKTQM